MSTVYVGCASIDERGKISGGKAGNQSGKELVRQKWYKHSKGWRVLRHPDAAVADKIASCMEWAVENRHIGYDQGQRNTLYNDCKDFGFDVRKVSKDVETDCSALVRVCCAYAGVKMPDFTTGNEADALLKNGFTEMKGTKYTNGSVYLCRGDILCTKTKGHTAVVLNGGDRAERTELRRGSSGEAVKVLQRQLVMLGFDVGACGVDGDFGPDTEAALREFQRACGAEADGVCGEKTREKLKEALERRNGRVILITGGSVNLRAEPSLTGEVLKTARSGDTLPYLNYDEDIWHMGSLDGRVAWVSGRYSLIVSAGEKKTENSGQA